MTADIVSMEAITIEELLEKTFIQETSETEDQFIEKSLPVARRFGIVDLWHIRNKKRHTSIYRNR